MRRAATEMPGISSICSGRPVISRLTWTKRSKSRWPISPRRMRSLDTRASSARRRRASCSALISSEKNATPGGAEGDLRGQRRLAHAGASGQDHQIRRMQPAHLRIQVAQAGGQAGHMTGAVKGPFRPLDRSRERLVEDDEPAGLRTMVGQFEQALLGGPRPVSRRPAPARPRRRCSPPPRRYRSTGGAARRHEWRGHTRRR